MPRPTACFLIGGLLLVGSLGIAGDLAPPPGPVAPTMRTLDQVEPRIPINAMTTPGDADSLFMITQSGTFYLTGNVTGVTGKHGIEIAASGVTLDLNGFSLSGIPGMGDFRGVTAASGTVNITVMNGSVSNWGGDGIYLGSTDKGRIEGVSARGNAGHGLHGGDGFTVAECEAYSNGERGIGAFTGSIVTECVAAFNGDGIWISNGGTISRCAARENQGVGIEVSIGCTLTESASHANGEDGIKAGSSSIITGCTSASNTGNGIRVSIGCQVLDNVCRANGALGDGAGILASGRDNRLEGNLCQLNDRGVDVDFSGNFIARNICSGNATNWDIVAGNICLVVQASLAPAVSGDSGGIAPGSTDPNANFTY